MCIIAYTLEMRPPVQSVRSQEWRGAIAMNWLRVTIERRYTRDHQAPLWEGSLEEGTGWRCIPVPPGPPEDGWEVFDTSKD
jgi:hypothetical protein